MISRTRLSQPFLRDQRLRHLQRNQRAQFGRVAGASAALLVAILLFGGFFSWLNNALTDLLFVSAPVSGNVVIVGIDNDTLSSYGRTVAEWPRTRHAQLLKVLSAAGARAVVFDILFSDLTVDDEAFAASITSAAESEARTRTVLASFGDRVDSQTDGTQNNSIQSNTTQSGNQDDSQSGITPFLYETMLTPSGVLAESAAYTGHVNAFPDSDSRVRRVRLFFERSFERSTRREFSLGVAAYLAWLRVPSAAAPGLVKVIAPDTIQVTPQRSIPVGERDQMLIRYFGTIGTFPRYSYRAVAEGFTDPAVFKDKLVLVGMYDATGATDAYLTPVSSNVGLMPGVEIHANEIETLLQNKALRPAQPTLVVIASALGLLLYGVIAVRLHLWQTALLFSGSLFAVFVLASVAFSTSGVIVPYLYPWVGLVAVQVAIMAGSVRWETQGRQQAQLLLQSADRLIEKRLTLNDVVRQIAIDAAELTHANGSVIHIRNVQTGVLELHFHGRALPADELAQVQKIAAQSAFRMQTIIDQGYIVAPLLYQGESLGTVAVHAADSEAVRVLLELYTELTAPALSAAQLYTTQLRQRDLLENTLNSSPDPVLVLDQRLCVARLNTAALSLFIPSASYQQPAGAWDGQPLRELWLAAGYAEIGVSALYQQFPAGIPFEIEVPLDAQQYVALAAPLRAVEPGWVIVLHDITSMRQVDSMRTQMLRMASHDLKNPLGVIMGYVDILMDDDVNAEQRDMLAKVLNNAMRMKTIIADLLNLERLRSASMTFEAVDFSGLIDDVVEIYIQQAEYKRQSLTLRAVPGIIVSADLPQLREALSNLIGNAIKYTPEGGAITVAMEALGSRVVVFVKDTGYGIPKDAQAKLFTPFYRVRTADTLKISGTGLGLSLVKTVIEAHRGRVTVDSIEGKGSTFIIELPIVEGTV